MFALGPIAPNGLYDLDFEEIIFSIKKVKSL